LPGGTKRPIPPRPREQPPSLPRSPDHDTFDNMSCLSDVLKAVEMHSGGSRQSVASNQSSTMSSPPSPSADQYFENNKTLTHFLCFTLQEISSEATLMTNSKSHISQDL
uniref:Uncharacterized protein n=1 Tax=Megaselia scalaris TaxID=36166 RepID=T1GBR6_MEGSC